VFGINLARRAVAAGCHYFDFGGNPTVVKKQLQLDGLARRHEVAIVPDCGLAPGLANVLAVGLIEEAGAEEVDSVQIRVGCLPQQPRGTLQYQLAFYPGGLINEYAEPCEIIIDGKTTTVEPLTRLESLQWKGWDVLEAFATAGGTSTMCHDYEGIVGDLEYKTIRYPGHGQAFRAMLEIGLFEDTRRTVGDWEMAPRALLESLLAEHLPQDEPDVVLLRVNAEAAGVSTTLEMLDRHDGRFSALARTTAFPATALCDLVIRRDVKFMGAAAMHNVAPADLLMEELGPVGLTVDTETDRRDG
jgi:lysine 6-dehydrogenase